MRLWSTCFRQLTFNEVHENYPIFKPQTLMSIYVRNSSTHSNFKPNPLLQMIINQLKENMIQRWLLYIIKKIQLSLKYGFTVWHLRQKEDFLSIIHSLVQYDFWSFLVIIIYIFNLYVILTSWLSKAEKRSWKWFF